MIKYNVQQNTEDWLNLRAGIITASEVDSLVTPLWRERDSKGVDTYLCRKAAERWLGRPLETFSGGELEQGSIKEETAIPWYEFAHNVKIERVGFITTDDGKLGCSPDGLLAPHWGIEIKCPMPHTQVSYLLSGEVPNDYLPQVHTSMLVTGADLWTFFSYQPQMPKLVKLVYRDEKIIAAIQSAVNRAKDRLEDAYDILVKLNGKPPKIPAGARVVGQRVPSGLDIAGQGITL